MNIFQRAKIRYLLHRYAIDHALWLAVTEDIPCMQGLTAVEKAHLRELTTLFLQEKSFFGAHDLEVSQTMAVTIAVQACLPILNLGLSCLTGWSAVIIYPGAFHVSRDAMDTTGVVHHEDKILAGESWLHGPLIVSWEDVWLDSQTVAQGNNVVIHEIAHKLDMLNGSANGFPPLHNDMDVAVWTKVLSTAYQELLEGVENQHRTLVNPYAATCPAEFFAVSSELFFCAPEILHTHFAAVYQQLHRYYRQDPWRRMYG
jgi:Mlc titration factor MtfA (ptsG expression regulator)